MKKRFIAWMKRESGKRYIIPLLGLIAFLESIIFPVPVDVFTLTLASVQPKKWFTIATVATISSVLGGVFAYFLGAYFFNTVGVQIIELFGMSGAYEHVLGLFSRGTFLVMFMSAFTPIPYKLFTLAGGALGVPLLPFIVASLLGRGLRFYIESFIPFKYGEKIGKKFYKWFNNITLVFALVVIAGFVVYKYLF